MPAEIESAVKDGLIDAFCLKEAFAMKHVEAALRIMVPLSKSFADQIAAMNEWGINNAIPASKDEMHSPARLNAGRVLARKRV